MWNEQLSLSTQLFAGDRKKRDGGETRGIDLPQKRTQSMPQTWEWKNRYIGFFSSVPRFAGYSVTGIPKEWI
jgi:hypothetical protein